MNNGHGRRQWCMAGVSVLLTLALGVPLAVSGEPPTVTGLTIDPEVLVIGQNQKTVTVSIKVEDPDGNLKNVKVKHIREGKKNKTKGVLNDDGMNGDVRANDGRFTAIIEFGVTKPKEILLRVRAKDLEGNKAAIEKTLSIMSASDSGSDEGTDQLHLASLQQGVIAMIGRNQNIPQEILDHPYVTGLVIRNWWVDSEPEEGVFDWSYFDEVIPQAEAAGKWVWLVIEAGGARNTPQWVFDAGIETFIFIDKRALEAETVKTTPVWWDPIFREKKTSFIRAMGNHFARNPTVISISAHDLNASTDDFHIPSSPEDEENWRAIGYTTGKMIDALKATIDVTMEAFPDRVIRTPIGRSFLSLDPDANFIAREVIAYAQATYPERFFFQRHALAATIPDPDVDQQLFIWELFLDNPPNVGAEMLRRVTNDPSCLMNGGVTPCDDVAGILREAVRLGKRYGTRYQEIFAIDILNPDLQDVIRFAQDVLTIPTVPMELAAISVSSTDIELDWLESSDSVGVTGYVVYRDDVEISAAIAPPFLDQTIERNTAYTYEVSAIDEEGNESERSFPLQVTPP